MSLPSRTSRRLITGSIMLATIMDSLDSTIANVALPHIRGSISATQEQVAWVLTSFLLAMAVTTPLTGWLAGRIGRKRVFLWSIAGFTTVSVACGLASSLFEIVLFRTLQGVCGAALIPLSQAVLLDINRPEDHGRAMAIWSGGVMVAPIFGPIVGGWLTDHASWRWIFYINLPIGILAFLGVLAFTTEYRVKGLRTFDFFGFCSLGLGIGALQLILDRGEIQDWFASPEICIEATVAGLCLYLFIVHTVTTSEQSFFNRALLRDRNFLTGTLVGGVIGLLFNATLALIPSLLHDLLGYPAVATGVAMAPRGIGSLLSIIVVGRLVGHLDSRLILAVGLSLMCLAQVSMSGFSLQMDVWPIIWSSLIQGMGVGFSFVPLSTLAFATLDPGLRTEGAAIFTLMRTLGGSTGIAITQALLTRNTQAVHAMLVEHLRFDNPLARPPFLADSFSLSTSIGLARLDVEVTRQATMVAYVENFRTMLLLGVVLIATLPLLRRRKKG
ncbi:DHA2 family efflux MFS transporter permease subunit [Telmatospirillum sp.]|uniref:DHA2 family efflux MFS transporter permease subunit n=1 Tax=Telmatospirillum sp. TaxID=2079197 RepID=UPI002845AC80|nr:DHA2 family efflux MFS transporter permease subunit [Telmatospirillum sp.]MDR3436097.1 DHA2 family efflux MFS transporter permease subunit [Telmatospirillum sp.]